MMKSAFFMMSDSIEFHEYILNRLKEDVQKLTNIIIFGTEDKDSLLSRVNSLEESSKDIAEIKETVNNISEKINALNISDRQSRSKIMIFMIILVLSYISTLMPKITSIIDNWIKYIL